MNRTSQRKNKKKPNKNGNDWGDPTPTRCHVWEISSCCCSFCNICLSLCTLVLSSSVFKMMPFTPRFSPWRHTSQRIHPRLNDYSKKTQFTLSPFPKLWTPQDNENKLLFYFYSILFSLSLSLSLLLHTPSNTLVLCSDNLNSQAWVWLKNTHKWVGFS